MKNEETKIGVKGNGMTSENDMQLRRDCRVLTDQSVHPDRGSLAYISRYTDMIARTAL